MARGQNFFYQDPTAAISEGLGRAFFGDPEARMKQQQLQAEMEERAARTQEARAHAGYYGAQTDGVGIQNEAARGLPALIAGLAPRPAAVPVAVGDNPAQTPGFDAAFDSTVGPAAHPQDPTEAMRAGLPGVIAAMAQMNGDKVDPTKVVGSLASFLGGDELARRGLIAQGQTPGANFAITPERADTIAATEAAAKRDSAWGVARINHASDVPVANIQASASRYSADKRLTGTEYAADARSGTLADRNNNPGNIRDGKYAQGLPGYAGASGGFARFATPQDGQAAHGGLLQSYVARGFNTPAKIANRWAPAGDGGNNPAVYAATLARAAGVGVNDPIPAERMSAVAAAQAQLEGYHGGAISRTGGRSAWSRPAAAPKPPRRLSSSEDAMLTTELTNQLDASDQRFAPDAKLVLRDFAAQAYQNGASPAAAVRQAIQRANNNAHANMYRAAHPNDRRPPAGATKIADGPAGPLALVNGKWVRF